AWDHEDPKLGLLRTRVSNNWQITKPEIRSQFYTKDQQEICRAIYEGLFQPDWVKQIDKQLQDDTDNRPWGSAQSVALFGKPGEQSVGFRGKDGKFPGIAVADLTADQKAQLQKAVKLVFEPYRNTDQDEVNECLKKQGGLDACSLAFYAQGDIGDDGVWDNWRLEGPAFVFYFRGSPHVHMWVNIGSDPAIKLNA